MSRLWLPPSFRRQAGLGLYSSTIDYVQPPSTYHFPTPADYVSGVSTGLRDLFSWGTQELSAALSPPAKSSATGIRAAIETTAGASITSLVSGALAEVVGEKIAAMMVDLVEGAVDAIVDAVVESVGSMIGDLVNVVPVLGQIVGVIIDLAITVYGALTGPSAEAEEEARRKAKEIATQNAQVACNRTVANCNNLRSTGWIEGVGVVTTPADLFRPMAYVQSQGWAQPGTPNGVPWCQTMFFAALCGGEDQQLFWQSRGFYDTFIARCRTKYNDPNLGIPREAQRRMKMLLNGIFKSVRDPTYPVGATFKTDGGRTLFPLLVDLIWSFYGGNQRRSPTLAKELPGYWDERLLREIALEFAPWHRGYYSAGSGADFVSANAYTNCTEVVDMVGTRSTTYGFMNIFGTYETSLINRFGDQYGNPTPFVTNKAALSKLQATSKRGVLVFTKATADKAVKTATETGSTSVPRTVAQKALLVAGGLGGSYLAYRGIKAGVKLVRKRRALRGAKRRR